MFELTPHYEQQAKTSVLVEVVMDDGAHLKGEIDAPAEGGLGHILNGLNQFIELRTYEGEVHYISKESMRSVRPMQLPEKEQFPEKIKRFLRADPYHILGISKGSDEKTITAAYQRQLKNFHEILDYLDSSYKVLNQAYEQAGMKTKKLAKLPEED
ncbi:MAG: hypothetical protein DHS20C08_03490 [Rhodomicrobium sp.]|nr:MAG: hypothetical protein DHS20C08_03490 [Rhodomicrobium sp.]